MSQYFVLYEYAWASLLHNWPRNSTVTHPPCLLGELLALRGLRQGTGQLGVVSLVEFLQQSTSHNPCSNWFIIRSFPSVNCSVLPGGANGSCLIHWFVLCLVCVSKLMSLIRQGCLHLEICIHSIYDLRMRIHCEITFNCLISWTPSPVWCNQRTSACP